MVWLVNPASRRRANVAHLFLGGEYSVCGLQRRDRSTLPWLLAHPHCIYCVGLERA